MATPPGGQGQSGGGFREGGCHSPDVGGAASGPQPGSAGGRSLCRRARLGADPPSVRELASPPRSGPAPGRRVLWLGRGGETHGRASASGLSGPRPARSVRSSVFPLQLLEVAGVEPWPRQVPEDLGILGLPQHQCPHASSDPVQIWRGGLCGEKALSAQVAPSPAALLPGLSSKLEPDRSDPHPSEVPAWPWGAGGSHVSPHSACSPLPQGVFREGWSSTAPEHHTQNGAGEGKRGK